MEFRETAFWQHIEQIFPPAETAAANRFEPGRSGCLCSYAQFVDRFSTSVRRAARNRRHAALLMLQFVTTSPERDDLLVCRVSSCIRSSDSLCTLGGGRVALLLEDVRDASALPMIIEKLTSTLSGHYPGKDGVARGPHPSLGASLFPALDMPVGDVWTETEAALEQALADGPGCYRIAAMTPGQTPHERGDSGKELYKAYRNGEFEFHYQPVIAGGGGPVVAFEALMRWRHPVRGLLPPHAFLPMLEDSGLIVPVGEKLLSQACRTAGRLIARGRRDLRICVNISARQLTDRGFLLSVLDALYETGLAASHLQLEFPESLLTSDRALAERILCELRRAGVSLAVDRFGTGRASLVELTRLPVGLIKLDHSLVKQLVDDEAARTLVAGVGALAGATGKSVAAVGVETAEQGRTLERLGCREVQGQYWSRPLPESEL